MESLYFRPINRIYALIDEGYLIIPSDKFKVLDLGFGSLSGYFLLEINNHLAYFKGVDEINEDQIEVKWEREIIPENEPRTLYGKYLYFVENHAGDTYSILTQEQLTDKFELKLNKKVELYIDNMN